jgi:hypothetical protein
MGERDRADNMESKPPILSYADSATRPVKESRFGIASACVGIASVIWFFFDPPWFESGKHDRIGAIASILGIILAFASYRQSRRRHTFARLGLIISVIALLAYFLFPTLD